MTMIYWNFSSRKLIRSVGWLVRQNNSTPRSTYATSRPVTKFDSLKSQRNLVVIQINMKSPRCGRPDGSICSSRGRVERKRCYAPVAPWLAAAAAAAVFISDSDNEYELNSTGGDGGGGAAVSTQTRSDRAQNPVPMDRPPVRPSVCRLHLQ